MMIITQWICWTCLGHAVIAEPTSDQVLFVCFYSRAVLFVDVKSSIFVASLFKENLYVDSKKCFNQNNTSEILFVIPPSVSSSKLPMSSRVILCESISNV